MKVMKMTYRDAVASVFMLIFAVAAVVIQKIV